MKEKLIRCVHIEKGHVRFLVPAVADNEKRLRHLGFVKAELEKPIKKPETSDMITELNTEPKRRGRPKNIK